MVFLDVALRTGNTIQDLKAKLRDQKVLVSHVSSSGLRLVTHSGISDSDIEETINAFKLALGLI
jgi:threonine aldolase